MSRKSEADFRKKSGRKSASRLTTTSSASFRRSSFRPSKFNKNREYGSVEENSPLSATSADSQLSAIGKSQRKKHRRADDDDVDGMAGIDDMARSSFYDNVDTEQVEEMREAFNIIDEDFDGLITISEFKTLVRALGIYISEAQVQKLVQELDTENIGSIDFSEYIYFLGDYEIEDPEFPEEELFEAFQVFDQHFIGSISMGDLRFALVRLGEKFTYEDVENFVKDAKPNEEYRIEYAEFCDQLTQV